MSDPKYRNAMYALVRYLLVHRNALPPEDWTAQGFGFLRLRVNENTRLHIWNSGLRIPGVSDIHDHAQWSFTSRIMSGQLVNLRFEESTGGGIPRYHRGTIVCGTGGGLPAQVIAEVDLLPSSRPEVYEEGENYFQEASEIHRTFAADGTVTLISQQRKETDTARVYWPLGSGWVDAIPRQATLDEINEIGGHALSLFGNSQPVAD